MNGYPNRVITWGNVYSIAKKKNVYSITNQEDNRGIFLLFVPWKSETAITKLENFVLQLGYKCGTYRGIFYQIVLLNFHFLLFNFSMSF